jgi:predicted  nucleic acid-binding Zn-ribbon protein
MNAVEHRIKALETRIRDMEARLKDMEARIKKAEGPGAAAEEMISPNELVEIRRIALARQRGDKGPLREWNRRQKANYS